MNMKIDMKKWNTDRLEIEGQIRALKNQIRREPRPLRLFANWSTVPGVADWGIREIVVPHGTDKEYAQLEKLKAAATLLYSLRAHARGRIHQAVFVYYTHARGYTTKHHGAFTPEQQADLVKLLLPLYELKQAA